MNFTEFSEHVDKQFIRKVNNKKLIVKSFMLGHYYHTGVATSAIRKYLKSDVFSALSVKFVMLITRIEIPEHYEENYVDNLATLIKIFVFEKVLKQDLSKQAKLQLLQAYMCCMCQKVADDSDFDKYIEYNVRAKPASDTAKEATN